MRFRKQIGNIFLLRECNIWVLLNMLYSIIDEGAYFSTSGRQVKDATIRWGEPPYYVAHVGSGQIMGWGEKAIEVRSLETGLLDGVFTHKRAQQFRFLCERNEKVDATFG